MATLHQGYDQAAAWPTGDGDDIVDIFEDDSYAKPKKNKGNKKGAQPVETKFEGYTLRKAKSLNGETPSWARVSKQPLPFEHEKLVAKIKAHRQLTRTGPMEDFDRLSENQQAVILRVIGEKQAKERNANADWILADVQTVVERRFMQKDVVKRMQIILKRQDRNATKPGEKTSARSKSASQHLEIIDLALPAAFEKSKNDSNHKTKKSRDDLDLDFLDDDLFRNAAGPAHDNYRDPPAQDRAYDQPPHNSYQGQAFHNDLQDRPIHNSYQEPLPLAPPYHVPEQGYPTAPIPPGAIPIPIDHFTPSARHNSAPNPFMPYPELAGPVQYMDEVEDRDVVRRPATPRRRSSLRRKSETRLQQVEDRLALLMTERSENLRFDTGSSEDRDEDNSIFSHGVTGGSFTPPSTPPLLDDYQRGGSLHHRRKSSASRPYERRSRSRPRYYQDDRVDVQPAYSGREGDRHGHRREHRYGSQLKARRASTYANDYPEDRNAEPRYLPALRPIRRITNYVEGYENADFELEERRRREDRRETAREGRRYSVAAGGGDYYT